MSLRRPPAEQREAEALLREAKAAPADGHLHIRAAKARLALYRDIARWKGVSLSQWVLDALDQAVARALEQN